MEINWEKEYNNMIASALQLHTKYIELKYRFENLQEYNKKLVEEIEDLEKMLEEKNYE